ncbi:CT392 family protein [Chlamydia buteonis]|uniref:CT392 family protein n=1 Tax=Chlamydia buteonis TaxID=2494525 RepID=UPI00344C1351
MASVSGNPGQSPNPIPEDFNSRLDQADTSKDQEEAGSGVTETGLSIEVLSTGELSNIDAAISGIQTVASAVIAVGAPSSLSPTSPEAAALSAEVVNNFYEESLDREDSDKIDETVADLFAGVQDSKALVDDFKKRVEDFQKTQLNANEVFRQSQLNEGLDLDEMYLDMRCELASLNGTVNELESLSHRLLASLGDVHHGLLAMSLEEFRNTFGNHSDSVRSYLEKLGLIYSNEGWTIDSSGAVPQLALAIQNQRIALEKLIIPTEEEFIQAATEAGASCFQSIINKLKTLWNTLVQMFQTLYQELLFFLLWIRKKLQGNQESPAVAENKKNPQFENPFASTSGTALSRENTSSLRASVSGRGDLSDEEMIRRPEDNTMDTQNVNNQDEKNNRISLDDF